MTDCTLDSSTVDWVVEHPETTALLEALEIDYTCPGKSLAFECRRRGLDPSFVLSQLRRVIDAGSDRRKSSGSA